MQRLDRDNVSEIIKPLKLEENHYDGIKWLAVEKLKVVPSQKNKVKKEVYLDAIHQYYVTTC